MSKGSRQRPTNKLTFDENYDKIFCSKSVSKHDQDKKTSKIDDTDFGHSDWRPANGGMARSYVGSGGDEYIQMENLSTRTIKLYNITKDRFENV